MSTNYYLEAKPPCECCGRPFRYQHIGKSSPGWCFSLHVDDEFRDLPDYIAAWSQPGAKIVDEYGATVSPGEMMVIITARFRADPPREMMPPPYETSWEAFHAANHSEMGPRGLLRHRLGPHCVGHGAGTWDLIPGEFS